MYNRRSVCRVASPGYCEHAFMDRGISHYAIVPFHFLLCPACPQAVIAFLLLSCPLGLERKFVCHVMCWNESEETISRGCCCCYCCYLAVDFPRSFWCLGKGVWVSYALGKGLSGKREGKETQVVWFAVMFWGNWIIETVVRFVGRHMVVVFLV